MTSLTRTVIEYLALAQGGRDKESPERKAMLKEITDKSMLHLYRHALRFGVRTADEVSDFVLFVLPELGRIVGDYRYEGVDFENYLLAAARRRVPSYYSQVRRNSKNLALGDLIWHKATEEMAESEAAEMEEGERGWRERPAREAAPDYLGGPPAMERLGKPGEDIGNGLGAGAGAQRRQREGTPLPLGRIARVCRGSAVWRKRMLIYLFHVLPFLSSARLDLVSSVFHLDPDELAGYHRLLRGKIGERLERRKRIFENVNIGYFRLLEAEVLLSRILGEGSDELVERKVRYLSQNKDSLQRKLAKLTSKRNFLCQRELAGVFGLSRGTVASSIHYARALVECALDVSSPKMGLLSAKTREALVSEDGEALVSKDGKAPAGAGGARFVSIGALLERIRLGAAMKGQAGSGRPQAAPAGEEGEAGPPSP